MTGVSDRRGGGGAAWLDFLSADPRRAGPWQTRPDLQPSHRSRNLGTRPKVLLSREMLQAWPGIRPGPQKNLKNSAPGVGMRRCPASSCQNGRTWTIDENKATHVKSPLQNSNPGRSGPFSADPGLYASMYCLIIPWSSLSPWLIHASVSTDPREGSARFFPGDFLTS